MSRLGLISVAGCHWTDVSVCLLEGWLAAAEKAEVCEVMEISYTVT